jgi:cation diffusion facilitator CzcD-associated flavoprotein CzcO
MEFWETHMPKGMLLRSGAGWHMDPLNILTFNVFLDSTGLRIKDINPIPVECFLQYGRWFADRSQLSIMPDIVRDLWRDGNSFEAALGSGDHIVARHVLITPGFRPFANTPEDVARVIPPGRYVHTCEFVDFDWLSGKRCLIIGGRPSAFEWAALIGEAGAAEVHLAYRYGTPSFERSDWTWVMAR